MDNAYKLQLETLKDLYREVHNKILPSSLTSWSRYYLYKYNIYIFKIPEFSKNTKLEDLIENLSEKYWNYNGSYNLESKGNKMVKHLHIY